MRDKQGRKVNYMRISLTDKCNLRCIYCMPEQGVEFSNSEMSSEDLIRVIKASTECGIDKIRFTGGEPTLYKDLDKLIYETSKLQSIKDISMTTNGIMLGDRLKSLKGYGLNRVNISLDTLKPEKFSYITRGGDLKKTMSAIESCLSLDMKPIKINTVLIKGINDDEIADFINLTKELPIHVRFIELMPIGEGLKYYSKGFLSSQYVLSKHPELIFEGQKSGETAAVYRAKGHKGTVQFISSVDNKFCSSCNRIRLTCSGNLKPCLHSDKEIELKEHIHSQDLIKAVLKKTINVKPQQHEMDIENKSNCEKDMFQIGG